MCDWGPWIAQTDQHCPAPIGTAMQIDMGSYEIIGSGRFHEFVVDEDSLKWPHWDKVIRYRIRRTGTAFDRILAAANGDPITDAPEGPTRAPQPQPVDA